MKLLQLFLLVTSLCSASSLVAQESYPLHPDSVRKTGVPKGRVEAYRFTNSKVFPGTERDYFVYIPAQYRPEKPAALMVFQDGRNYAKETGTWRVPIVFDNLIASGEMPVTIAVCINPGVVPGGDGNQHRFNRSFEYDTVSDRYARFLLDEILPEVRRKYAITEDPNLRGIAGSSSGAIAAFGVAWHRPDKFRRVFSTVGTFVGLRGGNEFPTLIRKTEPKPLRVFLQDGKNDLNIYGGSWWNANLTMLSALEWAGYEVRHEWGDGGHNGKHGGAILPDAFRWLWKDYDTPIDVDYSEHPELQNRFVSGEEWQRVSTNHQSIESLAVSPRGELYFSDSKAGEIWRVTNPGGDEFNCEPVLDLDNISGMMFDAQGNLYACSHSQGLLKIDPNGQIQLIIERRNFLDLVVLENGIYLTNANEQSIEYWPLKGQTPSKKVKVVNGPRQPKRLTVTPDRRFLYVVDSDGRYVWSYRIEADGNLTSGQPYSYLHLPADDTRTGADGATMTTDGSLIVASTAGLQIFDQPGRVHVITSRPRRTGRMADCAFAGNESQTLFVAIGGDLFRRKTKMTGIRPWQPATTPKKPRL